MTYIARNVLVGRAAMMQNRPNEAIIAFTEAAELQESDDFSSLSDPRLPGVPGPARSRPALLANNDLAGARREAAGALKCAAEGSGDRHCSPASARPDRNHRKR